MLPLWSLPRLLADLRPNPWMERLRLKSLNVWLGDGHFRNTLHFDPHDNFLCQTKGSKLVLLWEVFGECKNTLTLKGHQNAVLELHWSSDGEHAFTASADKTVALWDTATGGRVRQFKGHQGFVNTVCPARDGFVLASQGAPKGASEGVDWSQLARRVGKVGVVDADAYELCCFVTHEGTSTEAAIWRDKQRKRAVLAFRGTSDVKDLITDVNLLQTDYEPRPDGKPADDPRKVHAGFYAGAAAVSVSRVYAPPSGSMRRAGSAMGGSPSAATRRSSRSSFQ